MARVSVYQAAYRPASTNGHGPRRALTAEVILGTRPSLEGGDKDGKCRPLKGSRPVSSLFDLVKKDAFIVFDQGLTLLCCVCCLTCVLP